MKRICSFHPDTGCARVFFALAAIVYTNGLLARDPELFDLHANGEVYALAVQPDGGMLVGGQVYQVDGRPRTAFTRLMPDGSLDLDFHAANVQIESGNAYVDAVLLQPDGRMVIHGNFVRWDGQALNGLARLNADGTLDSTFVPGAGAPELAIGSVLAMQTDGKMLAHAWMTNTTGEYVNNFLVRLNPNGSLDPNFKNPATGQTRYPLAMCVAFDGAGKIVVGGQFTSIGGQACINVARLDKDGSVDPSFVPAAIDPAMKVTIAVVQPDGKVLIGGWFRTVGGVTRTYMARLYADGRLDLAFNRGGGGMIGLGTPNSVVLQIDGKVIVVGFSDEYVPGQPYGIRRLNADGTVDDSFDSSIVGEWIYALALQADGRVLVGGYFTMSPQSYKPDLGRLTATEAATQSLTFTNSNITWLRGGAGPEVWATTFEYSTNGLDWVSLGAGTRISGGWQRAATECPAGSAIRARGFTSGGKNNGSSWYTENVVGRPGITTHPASRTNNAGTTATFHVVAGGTAPLIYQWLKDGVVLTNNTLISGADSPTLIVSNVIAADAGRYSVLVSNGLGQVRSLEGRLLAIDPAINVSPTNQLVDGGSSASLTVTAGGTSPLTFQWLKNGIELAGATNAEFDFSPVQWTDRGSYQVVVRNLFGSVTSEVAVISVNMAGLDPFHTTNIVGAVTAMVVQPDGRIVVASEWSEVSEMPIDYLVRLNGDGTLDESFNPRFSSASVKCLALQPDGKIVVGGNFTQLGGGSCTNLARLNSDGSLDPDFNPAPNCSPDYLLLQPDGKLLVGSSYLTNLSGVACPAMGRLNPDGTLDRGFHPQVDGIWNYLLAEQTDGKILVECLHTNFTPYTYARIERLNPDGTLDPGFTCPEAYVTNWYFSFMKLAVLADGKFLVWGAFDTLAGVASTNLARLNPDGTFDTSFVNPQPGWSVGSPTVISAFAEQADGRMLVGGYFLNLAGTERRYIGRLEPDGTLDETYNPNASDAVTAFAFLSDGRVLAGGTFWQMAGQPRRGLACLTNPDPAVESLSCDGSTIAWLRGASSPEIWNASFDYTNDGTNWLALGVGNRIPGGWKLAGVSLPSGATVRARGYIANANSSWFVENVATVVPWTQPVIALNGVKFDRRSNQFCFTLGNAAGAVIVEGSTNLLNWLPLATNAPGASQNFTDPKSTASPAQFYRLRRWPRSGVNP